MDALSAALQTQREEAAGVAAAAAAVAAAASEAAPATAAHEAAVAALGERIAAVGGEVEALHLEVAGLKEMAVEQGREIGTLMADGNGVAQSLQQQVSSAAKCINVGYRCVLIMLGSVVLLLGGESTFMLFIQAPHACDCYLEFIFSFKM